MTRMAFIFLTISVFYAAATRAQVPDPFFLAGDGRVVIVNANNGRKADVRYRNADGTLNEAAFLKIDRVFGFPTAVKGENVSRRTIAFLDYFIDAFNPQLSARMTSGYRSPEYNNQLRKMGRTAAKTSTHTDGMAIDFSLPGVNGKILWDTIREKNCCGAGNYHGNVVHLDSGRPRFWVTETSKVWTNESDDNRQSYLSTEYDRYAPESEVRLLFTSISDFGFGVKDEIAIVTDAETPENKSSAKLYFKTGKTGVAADSCLKISEHKFARFIYFTLPKKLKPAVRYRVQLAFCDKVSPEMPDERISNPFEIVRFKTP